MKDATIEVRLDTPHCTVAEYARRTGASVQAVKSQVAKGLLPTIKMNPDSKKGAIYINMMKLAEQNLRRAW